MPWRRPGEVGGPQFLKKKPPPGEPPKKSRPLGPHLLLLLLGFSGLVAFLDLLDDPKSVLKVEGRHRLLARGLHVGGAVGAGGTGKNRGDLGDPIKPPQCCPHPIVVPKGGSHLLDEGGLGVGEDVAFVASQGAARAVEVDA